jgi:anti-sigma factor ChrR (cupin superfamily)
MNRPRTQQELDLAALAAALDVSENVVAAVLVAEAPGPVAPAPGLKARLMSRVAAYESVKPIADVRRNESAWLPYGAPGVDVKRLFKDDATGRTTVLLRMAPGSRLPAHHHHDVEQCLVVKGDVCFGDLVYEEGDFVVMGEGSDHPEIHSVHGNVLLLVAGRTEFLHA